MRRRFTLTAEQIDVVSDIGRKTAADRIATAACHVILEGNEGKADVTLRSARPRGKSIEMSPARFEILLNLTMDIVAEVRRSVDDRRDVKASDVRNLVFALIA